MSTRLLVAVPLCDYEPITTEIWHRQATYYLVRACLQSFARHVRSSLTLYILADRCSDRFVRMAQQALRRFEPITVDNSTLRFGLDRAALPDRLKHVANQILRTVELSSGHDLLYFCEQDYLFSPDALDHATAAFAEIPEVNVLSPFDHPDRHRRDRDSEYGRHRYFTTSRSTWKSVSSTNGNWFWRASFAQRKVDFLEETMKHGGFDFAITNRLYRDGELLLCPVRSLIQHYRLDGSNASPTFGFSARLAATRPIGQAISRYRRLRSRLARLGTSEGHG